MPERVGQNPLLKLEALGQSVWLDFMRRGMLASGELQRLIDEDGLAGVTANPSIFEKAIDGTHDYDEVIGRLAGRGLGAEEIYEAIAIEDVQHAADLFRPLYERSGGMDGFVSLEVSPRLAHDTHGTMLEAHKFWSALGRPNVMIKVPGTREGLPAIRQLTAQGINVNITLLFGLKRYREVVDAYLSGLEERVAKGLPLGNIHSVASFFLSRIDVLVDPMLEKMMQEGGSRGRDAGQLRGKAAIASAKQAYQIFKEIFEEGKRFGPLAGQGGQIQRLLWASTSTKNPDYPDLKYVEPLIGAFTVNTMPVETLEAYRDHGQPNYTIEDNAGDAADTLKRLADVGIDIDQVTQQLEDEGVAKFDEALSKLLEALERKRSGTQAAAVEK